MEKRINIAKLLKECPEGMELDCTVWENLYLKEVTNSGVFSISCYYEQNGVKIPQYFTEYGCYNYNDNAKCIIFPKGKTTWEGFIPPVVFKDGDILAYTDNSLTIVFIHRNKKNERKFTTSFYVGCTIKGHYGNFYVYNANGLIALGGDRDVRPASEEEKEKLFKAIEKNGYRWNAETKTLEKLKADKFDINTLKPFDKVLVRHYKDNEWSCSLLSHIDSDLNSHCYKYVTIAGKSYPICIPYKGNKHLLGTTDDCDKYFKTWEK